MVANQFDLSAGFNLGISQVLAIGLQGQGLPWWAAVGRGAAAWGRVVGLVNGVLSRGSGSTHSSPRSAPARCSTDSTPGTPADSRCWLTCRPTSWRFPAASGSYRPRRVYALVVSLVLWVVFEYLPLGRYLYVLGASPRAAELNGISAKRYVTLAFVAAGTLAAFAGIVLQSQLRSDRARSARNICCPPSPRRCSARPRSGRAGSTSGARCSPSPCSR